MSDATMPTILLVENDADTRRIYADVLFPLCGRVLEAGNPYEAFTYLRTHAIALVVTDLRMPGGGLQYVSSLRATQPSCPIVVITGLGGETLRDATLSAGATAFLEKPIRTKQLREIVHHFLSHYPSPCYPDTSCSHCAVLSEYDSTTGSLPHLL